MSATKVILLAVGLGCCVAVFTIYNSVLLRPLPYSDSDHILIIGQTDESSGKEKFDWTTFYSYEAIKAQMAGLDLVGFYRYVDSNFHYGEINENLYSAGVSPEILEILVLPAYLGEYITRATTNNGEKTLVMLSYPYWQRRFHADPSVIG